MWKPTNVYPTADGWVPPSWPSSDEMKAYEEAVEAAEKKTLSKRLVIVKHSKAEQVMSTEFMEMHKYSLMVFPLKEDSLQSGTGDERGYLVWVYSSPSEEQNVIRAFQSVNVDLGEAERVAVDPDSTVKAEQVIMTHSGYVCYFNTYEWEMVAEGDEAPTYSEGKFWK
mmetsp:Transcript_58848/g.102993  ORF Transcript_58848/g.102993 Transcript_58848/m.102993 type:complete len:168 (+) Transcript_58848:86-589(+)